MSAVPGAVDALEAQRMGRQLLAWQGSLFGAGPVRPDADFGTVQRRHLDEQAWVDHGPGWLSGADGLFDRLLDELAWTAREMPMYGQVVAQPRLSAWWDRSVPTAPGSAAAEAEALGVLIGENYGVGFDSVGANLYRDGRDSVAFHGDRHARRPGDPDAVVGIVSLGAPRRLLVRPRHGGCRSVRFDLAAGDILVMGGSTQRTWQHSIPKVASAGPRISVTYRQVGGR